MMKYLTYLLPFLISIHSFSQAVYVPDNQLMIELSEYGYDINIDGILTVEEAITHKSLVIRNENIKDFTGIEAFVNIEFLDCTNNSLTTLDLTKNTKLTSIICDGNQLTNLDLSKNILLESISIKFNQLTSLQLDNCPNLKVLDISSNQIVNLGLQNNSKLSTLHIPDNLISTLNLNNNTELSDFRAYNNQLTQLELTNNPKLKLVLLFNNKLSYLHINSTDSLQSLYCNQNNLTQLDIRGFENLIKLDATTNPSLNQICVIDSNIAKQKGFVKDVQTSWNQNCTAGITNQELSNELLFYPIPTSNYITLNEQIIEASIFDLNGKKLNTYSTKSIPLYNFQPGVYSIQLINNLGNHTFSKLIIQ